MSSPPPLLLVSELLLLVSEFTPPPCAELLDVPPLPPPPPHATVLNAIISAIAPTKSFLIFFIAFFLVLYNIFCFRCKNFRLSFSRQTAPRGYHNVDFIKSSPLFSVFVVVAVQRIQVPRRREDGLWAQKVRKFKRDALFYVPLCDLNLSPQYVERNREEH